MADGGWGKTQFARKVASIPLTLMDEWAKQGLKFNDHEGLRAKLNDIDYRKLRTAPGRL